MAGCFQCLSDVKQQAINDQSPNDTVPQPPRFPAIHASSFVACTICHSVNLPDETPFMSCSTCRQTFHEACQPQHHAPASNMTSLCSTCGLEPETSSLGEILERFPTIDQNINHALSVKRDSCARLDAEKNNIFGANAELETNYAQLRAGFTSLLDETIDIRSKNRALQEELDEIKGSQEMINIAIENQVLREELQSLKTKLASAEKASQERLEFERNLASMLNRRTSLIDGQHGPQQALTASPEHGPHRQFLENPPHVSQQALVIDPKHVSHETPLANPEHDTEEVQSANQEQASRPTSVANLLN